jgi:hypothetical protein
MADVEMSDHERTTLVALLRHEQTSRGEPGSWFGLVAAHVRAGPDRSTDEDDDVEVWVAESLGALESKSYVRKIGETNDSARFPIYESTEAGRRAVEA